MSAGVQAVHRAVAYGDLMITRRPRAAVVIGFIVLLLAGCGLPSRTPGAAGPPEPAATQVRSITVGGLQRSYRLYVPVRLAADPALVVVMHGGFGSAAQAERAYGWDNLADRQGFIVAYPDGKNRAWNAGNCCGRPAATGVDDVGFVSAAVGQVQSEFGVSAGRTFATGMSNGALMAYRLACQTHLFAAVAPVAGTIVTDCASPAPVSVLEIHGADDQRVRMDGQPGSGSAHVHGLPVPDVIALFRTVDGCSPPTVTTQGTVTIDAANCPDGRRVSLITISGAGHQWPGDATPALPGLDKPSTAINATQQIWDFFNGH